MDDADHLFSLSTHGVKYDKKVDLKSWEMKKNDIPCAGLCNVRSWDCLKKAGGNKLHPVEGIGGLAELSAVLKHTGWGT